MKSLISKYLVLFTLVLFFGCGKDEIVNIETTIPKGVSYTKATIGGTLKVDNNTKILSAGVCWSLSDMPSITDNKIDSVRKSCTYYFEITHLEPGKTYYNRAYVTTPYTTYYGSIREFKTKGVAERVVLDIEENTYNTIVIGTQTWMVQNLKTSKYQNGDNITYVPSNTYWANSNYGAWCNYENTNSNSTKYGRLYNWFAIQDPRKIAPEGWRISTESDWQTLIDYLGGEAICGGKLKDQSISYWLQPNVGATNESGFTARAGGNRTSTGIYQNVATSAMFWALNSFDTDSSFAYTLNNSSTEIIKTVFSNKAGLSVRCIKE